MKGGGGGGGGGGGEGGSDPDLVGSFLASSGSAVGRTAGTEHCPGGWTGTVHLSIGKQAPCGCPRCCRRPPREAPGTYTEHFDRGGPECGPGKARCNGSPPWNPTSNIPWTDRLVYNCNGSPLTDDRVQDCVRQRALEQMCCQSLDLRGAKGSALG